MRETLHLLMLLSMMLLSCSCSTTPETQNLKVQYNACTNLNPDVYGDPAPVVVTLYQLKSIEELQESDFFALEDNSKNILKEAVLAKSETEIRPNQTLNVVQEILPGTKYMAFVAAFRDIDNAAWKITIPIAEIKGNQLSVLLEPESIKVGSGVKG